MTLLKFTPNLKRYYPDLEPMEVSFTSIPNLISAADKKYPGLRNYILDDQGNLRKHVQIFIGDRMIRDRDNLSDQVKENDVVYIMQALSGSKL